MIINDQVWPSFPCQVLEYHPEPWDKWTNVGNLTIQRSHHAVHSVGHKQLPCLSGELACGMCVIPDYFLVTISRNNRHFQIGVTPSPPIKTPLSIRLSDKPSNQNQQFYHLKEWYLIDNWIFYPSRMSSTAALVVFNMPNTYQYNILSIFVTLL